MKKITFIICMTVLYFQQSSAAAFAQITKRDSTAALPEGCRQTSASETALSLPAISTHSDPLARAFEDFTHATGQNLPDLSSTRLHSIIHGQPGLIEEFYKRIIQSCPYEENLLSIEVLEKIKEQIPTSDRPDIVKAIARASISLVSAIDNYCCIADQYTVSNQDCTDYSSVNRSSSSCSSSSSSSSSDSDSISSDATSSYSTSDDSQSTSSDSSESEETSCETSDEDGSSPEYGYDPVQDYAYKPLEILEADEKMSTLNYLTANLLYAIRHSMTPSSEERIAAVFNNYGCLKASQLAAPSDDARYRAIASEQIDALKYLLSLASPHICQSVHKNCLFKAGRVSLRYCLLMDSEDGQEGYEEINPASIDPLVREVLTLPSAIAAQYKNKVVRALLHGYHGLYTGIKKPELTSITIHEPESDCAASPEEQLEQAALIGDF